MGVKLLATGHFDAHVIRETAYGVTDRYGLLKNEVRLFSLGPARNVSTPLNVYSVEWDAGDLDGVTVGIWADSAKKVTDYDGVFSLPPQIAKFLREQGFDTSEVDR
jgi:hypothetical protein